jgi:hypothetical protein
MKGRKTVKVKVPKRVAGVKIPKVVRKGPVIDFLNSSGGQVLIAEALLLIAGAYAARHVGESNGDQQPERLASSGAAATKRAARTASVAAERLSYAVGEALRAFRDALNAPMADHNPIDDRTDEQAEAEVVSQTTDSEPQKKRRSPPSRLPEDTIAALP